MMTHEAFECPADDNPVPNAPMDNDEDDDQRLGFPSPKKLIEDPKDNDKCETDIVCK